MSHRIILAGFSLLSLFALIAGCDFEAGAPPLSESSSTEFQEKLARPGLMLAKFGAPWCPPCREVDRELAQLAAAGDVGAEIVTVNVDDEARLAEEYQISSIPRLMLFQDGHKVKDHVGYASRDEIQSWIRKALAAGAVGDVQSNPWAEG